jgi:uncharacterized protein (TIGR03437 family)
MLRASAFLLICLASLGSAQTPQLTVISAASTSTDLSPESLASAFGSNLAPDVASAPSVPWPALLSGVSVQVMDAVGATRTAGLLFVSAGQVNFQVPAGTAQGMATITLHNGSTTLSTQSMITKVSPALFAVDTAGTAAATAVRIPIETNVASPVTLFDCSAEGAGCTLAPILLEIDAPVYLSLYGTGIKGYAQTGKIQVAVGDYVVPAMYAGPQGQYPGLDQVNVALPLTLRKAGTVDVSVTVDGTTSNTVHIAVQ